MNNWEKMVGDFVDANKNSLYDRVLVLVSIGSSKACSLSTHTSQKLLNYTENWSVYKCCYIKRGKPDNVLFFSLTKKRDEIWQLGGEI